MTTSARIMAENMRILRAVHGLSQQELSRASGISQSTIAQIETVRKCASLDTLDKIAKAFKTSGALLLTKRDWRGA